MALTDRNILITPNRGSSSDPKIAFTGADASNSATITLRVLNSATTGILSFEGSSGQLFSIVDSLSGSIFSVNDISGIPSLEIFDSGEIRLAEYTGNVLIGTAIDNGTNRLQVNGITSAKGIVLNPKILTVTSANTVLDFSEADHFHLTLQTNTNFVVSNPETKIGCNGNIILIQDATGGRTFTKDPIMKTPIGGAIIDQWTSSNSISVLSYYVVSSSTVIVNYIGNFA